MRIRPFLELIENAEGQFLQTDDVLSAVLPLFRRIALWHEQGLVAPLHDLSTLILDENGALQCQANAIAPTENHARLRQLDRSVSTALQVVGHARITSEEESGTTYTNLDVSDGQGELPHPAYLTGYQTWEHAIGHHDGATDILSLGQILASLCLNLDFTESRDLHTFALHRSNLFLLNNRLHPVMAAIIVEMTELNRHRRAADLGSLIFRLENYREQIPELDLAHIPGIRESTVTGRRKLVQARLRDRLFDLSRRNRLLYFKPSQASLNLTVASIPLVLNLKSIRIDQLFVWHQNLALELADSKPMNLGRWLRFEDQVYLPSALDKLIADARRDRAEFGFAQLRLVLTFLNWHNLKEAPHERISSPLLLLPVELSKKKGVRDQYFLTATSNEAEVNPVLRHHLRQLYGLRLPESIDLREVELEQFHQELKGQIQASEPGVTLRLLNKPEVELIHQRAKQRLARFQQKQTLPHPERNISAYDYSYKRDNFRPLGLQLFREKVLPTALPQRVAAGGLPKTRMPHITPASIETERQTYSLQTESASNPYTWDFDLCSLTVANFNYRKMSLVRDYGALLEGEMASEAFDRVFSLDPRPFDEEAPLSLEPAEEWSVVPGDATQRAAIALARTGRSYIIQGPPGTGKSQTITNLVADYVARGKRVLFVCEKRAAIDVVFHRLRQRGLDELCCLIHDSQTDKKSFIMNLKQTYETWLVEPDGRDTAIEQRANLLQQMRQDLEALTRFDRVMRCSPDHIACPVRQLLHRMIELRDYCVQLRPAEIEQLPSFAVWRAHANLARRLAETLAQLTNKTALAQHPFRWLGVGVIHCERPLESLELLTSRAESLLDVVESAFDQTGLARKHWQAPAKIEALLSFVSKASSLTARGQLELLNPGSNLSRTLDKAAQELAKHARAIELAQTKTDHWRDKLPAADVAAALAQAKSDEGSWMRWMKPSWWRLRRTIQERYDFSKHSIRPTFSQVLGDLAAEYAACADRDRAHQEAESMFGREPDQLLQLVAPLQSPELGSAPDALRDLLLTSGQGTSILSRLQQIATPFSELMAVLNELLIDFRELDLPYLQELIRDLQEEADTLPELLHLLTELSQAPPPFSRALRRFKLSPDHFEAAIAQASLEQVYHTERWLPRFDGRVFALHTERLLQMQQQWLSANASLLRSEVRYRFREHVKISTISATQLDQHGKQLKKNYSAGRRELEHEFGKSMRYKSIRDLVAGDSGQVIWDLKPIWLMSPLSVCDTLPLVSDLFDVVIFDEASQIPMEEAVPALYRAPQVIVVGDEMQLPPTSFFFAARDHESELFEIEEAGEKIMVSLEADSLLSQSAKNLPATLLAWHYRSRSESLISFSNAAFYAGNLYTVPDRARFINEQPEIIVADSEQCSADAEALLARPLSFHFMAKSPYEARRNAGEAVYIANLVRELLQRETKLSIGVVAFSEAQQSEIESALEALAAKDVDFARRLEEEYAREEDDQFCGLIIKNLENVQGDERDIILLSICFGPDANGRMVMNFGPINQRGGEKRLNVIFSRARQHMAVISSIKYTAITNDYNDGAAALKSFLHYAECASRGQMQLAQGVLDHLNPLKRKQLSTLIGKDEVISQIANALKSRGYVVGEQVGQSRFRCDLAVAASHNQDFRIAIMVDTVAHYANTDVVERTITQPEILRKFGWQVASVLTRDWFYEPQAVLDRIERLLNGEHQYHKEEGETTRLAKPQMVFTAATEPDAPVNQGSSELTASSRRLELIEGNIARFWQISQSGCLVTVRFGRVGTQGQTKTRIFDSVDGAAKEVEKLTAEKLQKGYIDAC